MPFYICENNLVKTSEEDQAQDYTPEEVFGGASDVALSVLPLFFIKMNNEILTIEICKIQPVPKQPRKYFDQDSSYSLKASIASSSLLEPIMVRKIKEKEDFI
jgi:hypothetical protein